MITLYHGTTKEAAKKILQEGWEPNIASRGGNQGNPNFLYVTNEPENALWFAQEKGDDVVLILEDYPLELLKVDPEDGIGASVEEELLISQKNKTPAYFIIQTPLSANKIRLFSGTLDF